MTLWLPSSQPHIPWNAPDKKPPLMASLMTTDGA
jgi:hypothetical protein